jgi:CRP-like cAMP-binding protein
LQCVTACLVLEAEANKALTCLKIRPKAAFGAMRFLAMFTDDLLSRSNRLTMNSKRESLLLYFYAASSGKQLPARLSIKKDELDEQLNLNLRTLYRQLDELEAGGFLHRIHGKIEIDAACRAQILGKIGRLVEQ